MTRWHSNCGSFLLFQVRSPENNKDNLLCSNIPKEPAELVSVAFRLKTLWFLTHCAASTTKPHTHQNANILGWTWFTFIWLSVYKFLLWLHRIWRIPFNLLPINHITTVQSVWHVFVILIFFTFLANIYKSFDLIFYTLYYFIYLIMVLCMFLSRLHQNIFECFYCTCSSRGFVDRFRCQPLSLFMQI